MDDRVGPEIHVGDPHGQFAAFGTAILDTPGSGPVDDFIEVPANGLPRFPDAARRYHADRSGRQQGRSPGGSGGF